MRRDLRESEFRVVGIHFSNLLPRGCPQNLDNLHQLIHTRITRKYRLTQEQLGKDAARWPDVYREIITN